jgi:hypothetical protein
VLTCGGLAVMAKFGIVDDDGVNWVWPLLPIAAQVLLRTVPRRRGTVAPSRDRNSPQNPAPRLAEQRATD